MAPQAEQPDPPQPTTSPLPSPSDHHDGLGVGYIILIVLLAVAIALVAYIAYINYRARKHGQPAPGLNIFASAHSDRIPTRNYPARGGVLGWAQSKIRNLQNSRTAGGAYEGGGLAGPGPGRRGRGFRGLDPDEAWDARVGDEADVYGSGPYYGEDTELRDQDPMYGGAHGYAGNATRGRSRERASLDARYEEETGMAPPSRRNDPFSDRAEPSSLRGRSPSPDDGGSQRYHQPPSPVESASERKSAFRESGL